MERDEATALIRHCRRPREKQTVHSGKVKGRPVFTAERPLPRVARLIGIYTGTQTVPPRLLAHMHRWARLKLIADSFVEFNGKPFASVRKGFKGPRG